MMLTGKNLCERQKLLNKNVIDAAKQQKDFNSIKHQVELSDVDKLFKIDLAANYKDVEYILEILKCGDALYISRAIKKSTWICDKDFMHIINSRYLANNVFPLMSLKMRNKILIVMATNLNDSNRAICFYKYCISIKLVNVALKFLLKTPESFRMDVINEKSKVFNLIIKKEGEYLKHLVGESFLLAESYVKNLDYERQQNNAIYLLRYMYSLSNEKYLDMCETYGIGQAFGRRLSKAIIQNHKERVMKIPLLYVKALNQDIVSKNCSIEEAKIFSVALLPKESSSFFTSNYCKRYKFILDLIPENEKFSFIKNIFTDKYPGIQFETCLDFFSCCIYDIMTLPERETWALKNIASHNEILGNGKDYLWYKFVNFDRALTELKIIIMKTTDGSKRCDMLKVLIESANCEEDLTKLLNYFCERHMNEVAYIKNDFIAQLFEKHNVLRFGEDCWMALEKIFYRLDVFDKTRYNQCNFDYRVAVLMYYILHQKPVLQILNEYLDMDIISLHAMKDYEIDLKQSEKDLIFQYIMKFYTEKIEILSRTTYDDETKTNIRRYLRCVLNLCKHFNKTKDDIPVIIHTYARLDWSEFKNNSLLTEDYQLNSSDIIHYLKEDAELVVSQVSKIKYYIEYRSGNINWLVKKLKIYFSHDLSVKFVNIIKDWLMDKNPSFNIVDTSVRAIFILTDEPTKIDFLQKYAPQDKKIDYHKTPSETLYIQRAICRQMHCSRPPMPLANVMQYVIGDYVQHCLTLFRSYLLNLTYPQCQEFIQSMINKPVSVQKHGIRLAFECFDGKTLTTMILDCWNKTKNVSLRMVLYKSLYMRILNENEDEQLELFEVLLTLTSELNEDDNDELFNLIRINNLPDHLAGRYLEVNWNTVSKFSDKQQNLERMVNIIKVIEHRSLYLFPENAMESMIYNHVNNMLDNKEILKSRTKKGYNLLNQSKWDLAISYLTYVTNDDKLKKSLKIINHITNQCIGMWDTLDDNNIYVLRKFLNEFIERVHLKSYDHDGSSNNVVIILQTIKDKLMRHFPEKVIYLLCWNIESYIITNTTVCQFKEIKETARSFGVEFGKLFKKYVENNNMYKIFYEQIMNIVSNAISTFYSCFMLKSQKVTIEKTDLDVIFCLGLLEINIFESYMMATKLLPISYEGTSKYTEEYFKVIKKLLDFPCEELQCYLYEKFVNTDFKSRQIIPSITNYM